MSGNKNTKQATLKIEVIVKAKSANQVSIRIWVRDRLFSLGPSADADVSHLGSS